MAVQTKRSKPFRVAAEGQTVDGRALTREEIQQMGSTYNPERYGARVWLEHFRGILPDGPFGPRGDVLSLSAQEFPAEDGQKKFGLYAILEALPNLIDAIDNKKTKYWSVEIDRNFANTGKAYCVGLADTNDPASLWTEPAKFSAGGAFEGSRHAYAGTVFSTALEGVIEWEEAATNPAAGLFDRIKNLFSGQSQTQGEIVRAMEEGFRQICDRLNQFASLDSFTALKSRVDALETAQTADRTAFTALKTQLSTTGDGTPPRPPAAGGNGTTATDC